MADSFESTQLVNQFVVMLAGPDNENTFPEAFDQLSDALDWISDNGKEGNAWVVPAIAVNSSS